MSTTGQPLPVSAGCFVCGHHNPRGLRLRFRRTGELSVEADCTLGKEHNGFQTQAHGGIVASLLDEAMGWATVVASGGFTYTVELVVRYHAPVPVATPLLVRGAVARQTRRLAFTEASVQSAEDGSMLASATGKFMPMPAEQSHEVAAALLYSPGDWRPVASDV